jgi:2-polyprenyl-3-methyl-5-hydroxy-6-metoxy-1,4-benzoquinol methylase
MISEKRVLSANVNVYRKEARLHDAVNRYPVCFERVIDRELHYVAQRLNVDNLTHRVLDLGCGTGYLTAKLARQGTMLVDAVDLSAEMVEILKTKVRGSDSVSAHVSDVMTFVEQKMKEGAKYDLIVMSGILHHLYDFTGFLKKAISIVRPGGYIYVILEPYRTKDMRTGYPFLILFQMLLRRLIHDREGIRERLATQFRSLWGPQTPEGACEDKLVAEFHQCCTKDFDYRTIRQTLLDAGAVIEKEVTYPLSFYAWNYLLFGRIKFFHDHFRIIAKMGEKDVHR